MHQSSFDKMKDFKNQHLNELKGKSIKIVDLGSQDVNGTYRPIFDEPNWEYKGADMEKGKNVDIVLKTPYQWKEIQSKSIDVVISGQALEHVEFFWLFMLEVARILKPGGICCIIAPSSGHEHRFPVDCWRFYKDGFSALCKFALLEKLNVYRQDEPDPQYTDSSNLWLDTVLICRKGTPSWLLGLKHQLWRFMVHRLSMRNV